MSVRDNIKAGKYDVKVSYPKRVEKPALLSKKISEATDEELAQVVEVKAQYERDLEAMRDGRAAYQDEKVKLEDLFREDLENEHGMRGHPKADKIFDRAWSKGHSDGYSAVVDEYEELVDLVK